jgi:hypothetical protein
VGATSFGLYVWWVTHAFVLAGLIYAGFGRAVALIWARCVLAVGRLSACVIIIGPLFG